MSWANAQGAIPVDFSGQPPVTNGGSSNATPPRGPQSPEAKLANSVATHLGNRDFDIDFFAYMLTMHSPETNIDLFRVILAVFREWAQDLDTNSYSSEDEKTVYVMAREIVKTMQRQQKRPDNSNNDTQPIRSVPNANDILD